MIRIEWKISSLRGNGKWHNDSERSNLETWVEEYNKVFGKDTHWIAVKN